MLTAGVQDAARSCLGVAHAHQPPLLSDHAFRAPTYAYNAMPDVSALWVHQWSHKRDSPNLSTKKVDLRRVQGRGLRCTAAGRATDARRAGPNACNVSGRAKVVARALGKARQGDGVCLRAVTRQVARDPRRIRRLTRREAARDANERRRWTRADAVRVDDRVVCACCRRVVVGAPVRYIVAMRASLSSALPTRAMIIRRQHLAVSRGLVAFRLL